MNVCELQTGEDTTFVLSKINVGQSSHKFISVVQEISFSIQMDKYKLAKLSEMSMSGYLPSGQSGVNKSKVKLKPELKSAQYFLFSSDLKPSTSQEEDSAKELLIVSEFVSGKIVMVKGTPKKVLVEDQANDVHPLGMAAIDQGNILAVIDEGVGGVSFLKYYAKNESKTLSLVECFAKTSNGNLESCLGENCCITSPRNVCLDWRPKDIVETKSGNIIISDTSSSCSNRLSTYTPDGKLVMSFGRASGPGNSSFKKPLHMAVDPFGRLFASDWENRNVQVFDSRGLWLNALGEKGNHPREGRLVCPGGISCDNIGNLFVCDVSQSRLVMFSSGGEFIENIVSKSRSLPSAVRINSQKRIMAVSYMNRKDTFRKFCLSGLPVTI